MFQLTTKNDFKNFRYKISSDTTRDNENDNDYFIQIPASCHFSDGLEGLYSLVNPGNNFTLDISHIYFNKLGETSDQRNPSFWINNTNDTNGDPYLAKYFNTENGTFLKNNDEKYSTLHILNRFQSSTFSNIDSRKAALIAKYSNLYTKSSKYLSDNSKLYSSKNKRAAIVSSLVVKSLDTGYYTFVNSSEANSSEINNSTVFEFVNYPMFVVKTTDSNMKAFVISHGIPFPMQKFQTSKETEKTYDEDGNLESEIGTWFFLFRYPEFFYNENQTFTTTIEKTVVQTTDTSFIAMGSDSLEEFEYDKITLGNTFHNMNQINYTGRNISNSKEASISTSESV